MKIKFSDNLNYRPWTYVDSIEDCWDLCELNKTKCKSAKMLLILIINAKHRQKYFGRKRKIFCKLKPSFNINKLNKVR